MFNQTICRISSVVVLTLALTATATLDSATPVVVEAFLADSNWTAIEVDADLSSDVNERSFTGIYDPLAGEVALTFSSLAPEDEQPDGAVDLAVWVFAIVP